MNKQEELRNEIEDFLNDKGLWWQFVDHLEKSGYDPEYFGFEPE